MPSGENVFSFTPGHSRHINSANLPEGRIIRLPERYWTPQKIERLLQRNIKALPFVKLKPNDQPMWAPENYWTVTPSHKFEDNTNMGREYGHLAIAAMMADQCKGLLNWVFADMMKAEAAAPNKKLARRLVQVRGGFFSATGDLILQMGRCLDGFPQGRA